MNWGTVAGAVVALVTPWPTAQVLRYLFSRVGVRYDFYFGWGCSGIGGAVAAATDRQWLNVGAYGLNAAAAAVCWWLSRRKRQRSAKLIGAKSRALLAAVVARMRETAKPRPVFRPVPGGTHA